MDDERAWRVIEQERLRLVAILEAVTPQEWEHPSLCAGWSVRDVAAHLTLISEPPPWTAFLVTDRRDVLFDLLVHVQDVAVALGRDTPMPPDAAAAAAASGPWAAMLVT